ncbi:PREDICTED: uncharacterized protein LOC106806120 [Priapulus caudatus]|uniref:Uncharacterized protein LOC106806120 n=1 Tax=Priapulus caudatus TaxID=37621 RepID=A0ABM1DU39_PRICU|nr:PREDICTED: uncharacterized protein LOC106806120 [Priapulus caudatus]
MWELLPAVALSQICSLLDSATLVLASEVSPVWRYCISSERYWRSFYYDCSAVNNLVRKHHRGYDWDVYHRRLVAFIADYAHCIRVVVVRDVDSLADVETVAQLAECCHALSCFEVSAAEATLRGARLRELQSSLWEVCARNAGLTRVSVRNVNLTREPCLNRLQVFSIFGPGQAQRLVELEVVTPSDGERDARCPRHVPALSMSSLKNLAQLRRVTTTPHDVDISTVRHLAGRSLRHVVLLCREQELERVSESRQVAAMRECVDVSFLLVI